MQYDGMQHEVKLERWPGLMLMSNTPKGRGVFATTNIPARTIIDVCPVLILGVAENKYHVEHTSMYHYTYNWTSTADDGTKQLTQAVVFGLGSMFNHSTQHQNVVWERDERRSIITYSASREIQKGEELCISYGSHLTFVDADRQLPRSSEEELADFNKIHSEHEPAHP